MDSDSQVVVLLCSMVGPAGGEPVRPLGPKEWSDIESRITSSALDGLAALLGLSASDLARELKVDQHHAERIAGLLDRQARMDAELERLAERGIEVLTRIEPEYPSRLRESLKHIAPPVLFTAGKRSLLSRGGVAVVGSRNIDENGRAFAEEIGRKCAAAEIVLVSGGARGTDAIAMQSAIEAGGTAVGVLADSLERAVRATDLREPVEHGRLALMTPYSPAASFTVGAAMGRNKLIYGLADYGLVVSSEVDTGGTWRGATEALKGRFCPVFVRAGEGVPAGNGALLKQGAFALPDSDMESIHDIRAWMRDHAGEVMADSVIRGSDTAKQPSLFE